MAAPPESNTIQHLRNLGGYSAGSNTFNYFIDKEANVIRQMNKALTVPTVMPRRTSRLQQGNNFLSFASAPAAAPSFEKEEETSEADIDDSENDSEFSDAEIDSWAQEFANAINEKKRADRRDYVADEKRAAKRRRLLPKKKRKVDMAATAAPATTSLHTAASSSNVSLSSSDEDDEGARSCSDIDIDGSSSPKSVKKKRKNKKGRFDTSRWREMYDRLVAYREEHGDAKVPAIYDRDPQLGKWVRSQRANYKNKKLSEERTRELNSIGFDWVLPRGSHRSWDKMYQRLIAYNNDSNNNIDNGAPHKRKYDKDRQLGDWVQTQRTAYKSNKLSEERVRLLDSVGFDWGRCSHSWDEMFQNLIAYKNQYNTVNVPRKYNQDRQLGTWVSSQRTAYKNGKLSEERTERLNSIGFDWEPDKSEWMETYKRLVAYKEVHNNTNVPIRYDRDPQLGRWISTQRTAYKNNKLSEEREEMLNSIGFDWGSARTRRRKI